MSKAMNMNTVYMPGANGGTEPAPYLLTKEEAARFLRIEGDVDIVDSLGRYHAQGLRSTKIGRTIKYTLADLIAFVALKSEE